MIARHILRRVLPRRLALAIRQEWLARRVVTQRGHIEAEVRLLPRLVKPTDVCWDIGANAGIYTLALSRLASHVLAFEPIPHSFEILEKVKRRAHLTNVTTNRLAIADVDGPGQMAIPTIDGFYGGYYVAALDKAGTVGVSMASIDRLIAQGLQEPDFIKCDVEGAETRVINGARSLVARRHPIWLMETFEDDVLPLMKALGYAAYVHAGNGEIERVHTRSSNHRNYVFLPVADTAGDAAGTS